MSEQTLDAVRRIRARLHATARRIDLSRLLFGLIITVAFAAISWTVLVAAEWLLWMGTTARTILLAMWILATVGLAGYLAGPPALRLLGISKRLSDDEVALHVGTLLPDVEDRLVNLIHLSSGKSSRASEGLLEGALAMLAKDLIPVRFEDVEQFERPRKAAMRVSAAPAILLLFALFAPGPFTEASSRLLSPRTSFHPPAPFNLYVMPGDIEVTRGDELSIHARTEGNSTASTAIILLHNDDLDQPEHLAMEAAGSGRFEHHISAVDRSLRYRVVADEVESEWYTVGIVKRPIVRNLQIRVDPPPYTGLASMQLPGEQGDVTGLRGSRVQVSTHVRGHDVESVRIEFDHADDIEMEFDGELATAAFSIRAQDRYRIVAQTADGIVNADPISFQIQPTDDEPPVVRLLAPTPDLSLGESLETLLGAVILDDYGFSRLELHYRLAESRYRPVQSEFTVTRLPIQAPRPVDQEIVHRWMLSDTGLDPVPGDVIEYFLQVWDNDSVSGPKSARSHRQLLRVPSLAEQYEEVDRMQESTADDLQRMLEEASDIRKDFDNLRNELRGRQESDWQSRRQVESLQERQQRIERRVDELTQQMQEVTRQLEDNRLISDETIEMYRELTRVIEEIKSPELQEALQQLQEAMEQLDLQRIQESLQDFEFSEDQYRQRLERSLELFKRARAIQNLEQAERMARELAAQQEELRRSTERLDTDTESTESPSNDSNDPTAPEKQNQDDESGEAQAQQGTDLTREQVASEQERLSGEMEQLEGKLEEIREQMDDISIPTSDVLDQLKDEVRQQQIPENMRDTGRQIRSNQTQDASQNQQQMQQQLEQLHARLSEMRSNMSGSQLQMNLNALRRTIRDIILLSQEQEDLLKSTIQTGQGSPSLPVMARDQVRIAEGVSVVADSVQSLARELAQINREAQRHTGEALREMERATESLVERTSRSAGVHQRAGMTHLNELGLMLSDLLDQLMNQAGGGSGDGMSAQQMAQQLQQMAQDQQRLNSEIQQMLNDAAGDRLTSDMQERLRQKAAQQDAIRRQLRQLSRDPAARDNLMNELNRIADQMQETIEELQERGASRPTIERQQQILTRLLEAEKSLQEREQDERRRGQTGEDVTRESPPEVQRSEEMERLRRDLLRALESNYAPDYQSLIRRYFELLQREVEQTP